ncbi:DUF5916 domain-containing protein [Marivirga arenosa]|uniref:DUF5916 domain-containing protein n=1 Tax=Marivirga arenosa TaxID=3059076 RepID=A0AA51N7Z4_9BACT|nr:DUF5916 domain-containing protein [Marivirga sp. ABR2-2]WMN07824.1 DUF5916 domain-containing protein [Marivirga sp. ABR2-2]
MHKYISVFLIINILSVVIISAKDKEKRSPREMETEFVENITPEIDGLLDDEFWQDIETEKVNFITFIPENGSVSSEKTFIKTAYTDFGIYIAAKMIDKSGEPVQQELGIRDDDNRNTDQFGVILDTYQNGQNAFYLKVSAAGVQTDIFINRGRNDYNWDAVWNSAAIITEEGWQVEIEIPYSAIRFPKDPEQNWNINFMRKIQSKNETSFWNYVDNSVDGLVNQSGTLTGLKGIKPPLRLQVSPYITAYYNRNAEGGNFDFTGGMDLKYGFTESFTLDMTLIPDFGQTVSDNVIYNLGPFEVQYAENRAFFTEGTELFNKGGLFYSRRVGQSFGDLELEEQDSIVTYPSEAPLLNASKITGRTKNGLGIGFFNAVTNRTFAEVYDKETKEKRIEQVDDLTNFNIMVVDQSLRNNSNISLINTNVKRFDGGNDANVIGTDFRLRDKTNTYQIDGFGAYNNIMKPQEINEEGYKYNLGFSKISGKYQFNLGRNVESDTYNPNDLGFLRSPNEISHFASFGYNQFQPTELFNQYRIWAGGDYSQLFEPKLYQNFSTWTDFWAQTKNFETFSFNLRYRPSKTYDYFEPRVEGARYFRTWNYSTNFRYSSDSRKALMSNISVGIWNAPDREQFDYWINISPRYRVNNQFSINYDFRINKQLSSIGFAEHFTNEAGDVEQIVFGERDIDVLSNVLGVNYTINNKMGFNFRLRHYWNKVDYFNYFNLTNDGDIEPIAYDGKDLASDNYEIHDTNFNAFNIDAVYSWQIAPGSFVNVVWKDAVQEVNNMVDMNFSENFNNVISTDHQQNLSIRIIYFLDYTQIKRDLALNKS